MATKRRKRSDIRNENQPENGIEKKKHHFSRSDKIQWALFAIALFCLWILTKFSA